MGAPVGNTNAKTDRRRIDSHLSIGDSKGKHGKKRLSWVLDQLKAKGIEAPSDRQIARFVIDFCYAKIDEQMERASSH